ncbi:MAG: hypothetical protein JWR38_4896 [Mucilaginibacter sp.]|nr:hypothetical protein [Mucilaginibacter sp.]
MLNGVKHLFYNMHRSRIDPSLSLRMTNWFYSFSLILVPKVFAPVLSPGIVPIINTQVAFIAR